MYGGDLSEIKILLLLFFLLSISTDLKLLQFVFTPHNRRRVIRREKTHKCRRASFFGLKLSHFSSKCKGKCGNKFTFETAKNELLKWFYISLHLGNEMK